MERNIVHGTNSGYIYKCRCELCKAAHAAANLKSNAEKRAQYPSYKIKSNLKREPDFKFVVLSKK